MKPISPVRRSLAVISYVRQTGESVVVGDALEDERFSNDPYIVSTKPRRFLCADHPSRQARRDSLPGEQLVPDAFTADRIEMLRILSAQAAISLKTRSCMRI